LSILNDQEDYYRSFVATKFDNILVRDFGLRIKFEPPELRFGG
jgi:hypothetical protein